MQNLQNSRNLQFQGIMSGANKAGMMYSNFPERSKYQYDTSTYVPAVTKVQQSYQTGLDKLRSNTVDLTNQLKDINDAIADLNDEAAAASSNNNNGSSNPLEKLFGDRNFYDLSDEERAAALASANIGAIKNNGNGGVNYYDNNGNLIRFGTYASRAGAQNDADILYHAYNTMPKSEFIKLYNIYAKRKDDALDGVFANNTGNNYQYYTYDDLSDDYTNFLNSAGLRLK